MCNDPAHITKPLRATVITVQGESIQLGCLFSGNLAVLAPSLTSYWKINFPLAEKHNGALYIFDNSSDLYRIGVYQTCLTSDASCCNFINQLTILNAPLSLNDATLSCTEGLSVAGKDKPVYHMSNTTFSKLILHVCRYIL